jgi:hypothetical protein
MNSYNRQDLEKLIFEEIEKMVATSDQKSILKEEEETDPVQQYIDWIVRIQESARETLQDIEGGAEPYKAALDSGLAAQAQSLMSSDFWHHYHG